MELKYAKNKRRLIIPAITFFAFILGFFLFSYGNQTIYIKNSASSLSIIRNNQKIYQAEDKIGDLKNNIIPKINIPENLTENFAGILAKEIIDKNDDAKSGLSTAEQGLDVPNPAKIAEDFIATGLKKANENILNIQSVQLVISQDNSKTAIEKYILETQKIIKENLDPKKINLVEILNGLNENSGTDFVEKLTPVIIVHETTANLLEEKSVPADLKELMSEEIRLLRITANIFRAIVSVENDPLATITAIKQFDEIVRSWSELQEKFNQFIKKFNKT